MESLTPTALREHDTPDLAVGVDLVRLRLPGDETEVCALFGVGVPGCLRLAPCCTALLERGLTRSFLAFVAGLSRDGRRVRPSVLGWDGGSGVTDTVGFFCRRLQLRGVGALVWPFLRLEAVAGGVVAPLCLAAVACGAPFRRFREGRSRGGSLLVTPMADLLEEPLLDPDLAEFRELRGPADPACPIADPVSPSTIPAIKRRRLETLKCLPTEPRSNLTL